MATATVIERVTRKVPREKIDKPKPAVVRHALAPAKTKGAVGETKGANGETFPGKGDGARVRKIPIAEIARHPENRVISAASVTSLATEIRTKGLLTPIRVRTLPADSRYAGLQDETYQLIAGERRLIACRDLLERSEIEAFVEEEMPDALALELLNLDNAARQDLTTAEKAQAIAKLHAPAEQGGGGLTWERAGEIYGMSASGAQNLCALLKAPAVWLNIMEDRQAPRRLHQATVRKIGEMAEHAPVMETLLTSYRERSYWPDEREDQLDWIIDTIDGAFCQRLDLRTQEENDPRLDFDDPQVRADLQIVRLPIGRKGALIDYALNVKLFKQRQEAAQAAFDKKHTDAAGEQEKKAAKALTPAQQKAKRQEQDEQLAKRIVGFRAKWLRALMADELSRDKMAEGLAVYAWLANESHAGYALRAAWHNAYEQAVKDAGGGAGKTYGGAYARPAAQVAKKGEEAIEGLLLAQAGLTLFPMGSGPKTELPPLSDHEVELMAELLGCDLAADWGDDRSIDWRRAFYEMHTTQQLVDLGKELKVECWLEKTKGDMLALLCGVTTKPPKSLLLKAKAK